jgi:outer membrane protein assembly factor BamD
LRMKGCGLRQVRVVGKMKCQSKSFVMASLFVLSFFLLLNGCSTLRSWFSSEDENADASQLMSDGLDNMDSGNYKAATEDFQKLKDRYPYSKLAVTAELKMADTLYLTEEYDQARDAYNEFEKLHPKHPEIPYVMYQKAMCQFMQMTTLDREQTHTLKAKEEFERLIARFPNNVYADRARKNLRKCLIFLADHEIYVGNFYFRQGHYGAALGRYTYVIKTYPDLGQYSEALEGISKCRQKLATEASVKQGWKSHWPFSIWK